MNDMISIKQGPQKWRSRVLMTSLVVRFFGASLLALTISGCGGGSGSSSPLTAAQDGGNGEESASLYQGATTPIAINQSNAETITRVLLSGSNETSNQSAQTPVAPETFTPKKQLNTLITIRKSNAFNAQIEADTVTSHPTTEVTYGQISGTNTIEDYTNGEPIGKIIFTFDDFNDGDEETVNGRVTFDAASYNEQYDIVTDSTITFDELRTQTTVSDETISGSSTYYFNEQTGSQTFTVNWASKNNITGESFRFENLASVINVFNRTEEGNYIFSESISGRIYISSLGYFDIITQSPFLCEECEDSKYLEGGAIQLKGANNSDILISVLADNKIQALLDEDGDDFYESTLTFEFSNLGL